jgi:hypothetical protein
MLTPCIARRISDPPIYSPAPAFAYHIECKDVKAVGRVRNREGKSRQEGGLTVAGTAYPRPWRDRRRSYSERAFDLIIICDG